MLRKTFIFAVCFMIIAMTSFSTANGAEEFGDPVCCAAVAE